MNDGGFAKCPFHGKPEAANEQGKTTDSHLDEVAAAEAHRDGSAAAPITGVLLVNHGSHSPTWRRMLLDVQAHVQGELLSIPNVQSVRTAFMEYTEPSIATQLKAFDRQGVEQVVLVPLLLTVSSHSFDDIPTICGLKSDAEVLAVLEKEGIACYKPRARVLVTPLLDYPRIARNNLGRRLCELRGGACPYRDACVLVGYGDEAFNDAWDAFFKDLADYAVEELGVVGATTSWCGHIVRYKSGPTEEAIRSALRGADRAAVVPMLVAHDEMFQAKIIGSAVRQVGDPERVLYRGDAILPEPDVERWVVSIVRETLGAHNSAQEIN